MTSPNQPPSGRRPSPVLLIFLIFPALGLVAAAAFALANRDDAGAPPTPLPVTLAQPSLMNQTAPNFELPGLDGGTYRLSSYRGQVVFINFWATWCEPCRRELPALDDFEAAGAKVLAVNNGETAEQVESFLESNGVQKLAVLLDADFAVSRRYRADRLPTTYVLDPAGVVRYIHIGEITPDDLAAYVAALTPGS